MVRVQRGQTIKPRTFDREYRTIQTGFERFFDTTGGDLQRPGHFDRFRRKEYAFKLPRMPNLRGGNYAGKDINVGRLGRNDPDVLAGRGNPGGTREDTFRMQPRHPMTLKTGQSILGYPVGKAETNESEYSKKLLFTWALNMDSTKTTAKFGRKLREYEKPDKTTSGLGQKGAGKRIKGPLSHAEQLRKFFWSSLSKKGQGDKLDGGGFHHGAGQGDIAAQGSNFKAIYENSVLDKYRMASNKASNEAMRDLLQMLPQVLTVDPSGKRSLETDSPEELMIAIADNTLTR